MHSTPSPESHQFSEAVVANLTAPSTLDGLSIIIPVYNSQSTLRELTEQLETVLPSLANNYEIIFVNDGSRDASWDIVEELAACHAFVCGVNLMRNYGQHNALLCGIRLARYSVIITMDDDLQHPPEQLPKLLAKLNEGFDVVYGTPQKEQHGLLRDLASRMTKTVLQNAMGADIAQNVSALRVFRTNVRDAFIDYRSTFISIDVLLTWGTTRFGAIPIRHEIRRHGTSNYVMEHPTIRSKN